MEINNNSAMVTPIEFLNTPIYSVGDTFARSRNESFSSGSGSDYFSYSYYGDRDYASEYYQMGEDAPLSEVRYENFHYYANASTLTVEDVSAHVEVNTLDSSSRRVVSDSYSFWSSSWGEEERSSLQSFEYVDERSNKLVSSFEIESSSITDYNGGEGNGYSDLSVDQVFYTYDYTGLRDNEIHGPWDYTTRWGVGLSTYENSDGDSENFEIYSKESRTKGRQGDTWQQMRVEIDENTGFITNTHISSDQYSNSNSSYSNFDTWDHDGDGIIDSMSQYSSRHQNGSGMYSEIRKEDYDNDGQADYIYMVKERSSRQGLRRTEYTYDTQRASRPILEIRKIIDTDGDGNPESEVENAMFRTLTPRHTAMGEHAVSLEDVLYVETQLA